MKHFSDSYLAALYNLHLLEGRFSPDDKKRLSRVVWNFFQPPGKTSVEPLLFRIGQGYQKGLSSKKITRGLRDELRKNGISLSLNATVNQDKKMLAF